MSSKVNWVDALEKELRDLPFDDRIDLILNYKEQIQAMLDEGKNEEEILLVGMNILWGLLYFQVNEVKIHKRKLGRVS